MSWDHTGSPAPEPVFLVGATASGSTSGGPLIPVPITPPGTTGMTVPLIPAPITPPGTTGGTGTVVMSNTPIGNLISGLINRNVFSATGRLFADGMGNWYATPSSGTLGVNTLVGTYNVYADCSITMTLGDPFVTQAATGGIVTTTTVPTNSLSLEGEIVSLGNANEIHLVGPGPTAFGAMIKLTETAQFSSCSNASLSGNYGVTAEGLFSSTAANGIAAGIGGTGVTTPATTTSGAFVPGAASLLGTPFIALGRFVADGAGNLVTDFSASTSSVKRTITGTYVVNDDCTGTARLLDSTGVGRNISFVLVNEAAACSSSSLQSGARQSLSFVFTDPGVIGSGTAKQQ
jgi:hypothetical protein